MLTEANCLKQSPLYLFCWLPLRRRRMVPKEESAVKPFDDCASPHPTPISILSKVGFLGGAPMMPLFPVWLFAGTQWGRRQWMRGSALVLRKPEVRLTELISDLICPDRYELLELAFMWDFRSIMRDVLGTIYLRLTDWDALLVTRQDLTWTADGPIAVVWFIDLACNSVREWTFNVFY